MNLLVLLLLTVPACLAQFSIQGPSDGNRVAQGLRIEEGKGIQYTDQNESNEGGFSITGATDGNAQIQGASDGHSNFRIHGASRGPAESYNVQGPSAGSYNIQGSTDGHSHSIIQGSYDGNSGSAKSLQYNDPSGLRVNWRSFDRQPQPRAQQTAQYSEAAIASAPRAPHRQRAHAPRQPQPPPQPEPFALQQSRPLDNAPTQIKQLLQLQAQLPYVNIIPEPYRYENLVASQGNQRPEYQPEFQPEYQPRYQPEAQEEPAPSPRRPAYRGKPRGPPRHRRQAPQYRPEAPAAPQQQHRRLPQPPAEPQIKYNPNLPPQLQQLLKYQAETPYVNLIPEQYRFNPEPAAQMQVEQVRNYYQDLLKQQPTSPTVHTVPPVVAPAPQRIRGPPQDPQSGSAYSRPRRQAPHQRQLRPQQLPAEPVPQYSTNVPGQIQSLLKYQAQIPYNIIANQIDYRLDKPYVPQPIKPTGAPEVQYQPPSQYQSQSQYQGQSQYQEQNQYQSQNQYQDQNQYQSQIQSPDAYQGQSSGYSQVYASQSQYTQAQFGGQEPEHGVRPVTERQY